MISRNQHGLGGDILEALAGAGEARELEVEALRAALWLRRNRHGGVARVQRTLAMLQRDGLLWIDPGQTRSRPHDPPRVGLTEQAVRVLQCHGLEALREKGGGLAAPRSSP